MDGGERVGYSIDRDPHTTAYDRIYKIFLDKETSNHKADEYLQLCTVQLHVMN